MGYMYFNYMLAYKLNNKNEVLIMQNNNNEIKVYLKNVYGCEKTYPYCEKSKIIAAMLGQKTLTPDTLCYIKKLGYQVTVINEMRG